MQTRIVAKVQSIVKDKHEMSAYCMPNALQDTEDTTMNEV